MDALKYAKEMDQKDVLAHYKKEFYFPEKAYYMDGNSLGLCSRGAKEALLQVIEDWEREGIQIWGMKEGKYYHYPRIIGDKMSKLIGAKPSEVVAMGSITSNLHQMLATFYQPSAERYKILVDGLNFPSDIYAVQSLIELKGHTLNEALVTIPSRDGRFIDEGDIIQAMHDDVALVLLPSVLYRSAQVLDMKRLTKEAHDRGIIIGWDLAHGIGALPYDFQSVKPDFAVWCTYKYLNGGPGAVAGLYVNEKHFGKNVGLKGWFGSIPEKQFEMAHEFYPSNDAGAFLQGSTHMFSMAPLESSLDLFLEAGMEALREKSLKLTDFLVDLIRERLMPLGFEMGTPIEHARRGGHIALEHESAYAISLAMRKAGVIPDFRSPNVIRLAPAPLYVGFEDLYHVVEIIESIVKENKHLNMTSDQLVY